MPLDGVDVDAPQGFHVEDDGALGRAGGSGERRAGSLRDHGYAVRLRLLQHGDDILGVAGPHHREGLGGARTVGGVDGICRGNVGVAKDGIPEEGVKAPQGSRHGSDLNVR